MLPTFCPLPHRGLLGLTGPDASALLQGTCTQDVRLLESQPLLYAAHLTPQGRLMCDFLVFQHNSMLVLDVATTHLLPLAKSLHRYSVGLQVELHDMSANWQQGLSATATPHSYADPRHPQLPQRVYAPKTMAYTPQHDETLFWADFHLGIADGVLDNPHGKALPAELGLDKTAISFTKGCYVGQEVTARLHHKAKPTKQLYKCTYTNHAPTGTPVMAAAVEAGWLGRSHHGHA
ncbi:MAG: hypothetical protein WAX89_04845, partial [Alphaproteobacteria bacterium]